MQIHVLYFAALRELRGLESEHLEVDVGITIGALFERLFGGANIQVAYTRNRTIVPGDTALEAGDEVSFLPPLGGG